MAGRVDALAPCSVCQRRQDGQDLAGILPGQRAGRPHGRRPPQVQVRLHAVWPSHAPNLLGRVEQGQRPHRYGRRRRRNRHLRGGTCCIDGMAVLVLSLFSHGLALGSLVLRMPSRVGRRARSSM
jgi:hypothetical protein